MLEKLGVLVVGNLNVMTLICLALAAMCLGVVIIVLVSKFLSKPRPLVDKLEDLGVLKRTYNCSCINLCSVRVDGPGKLCPECEQFGCRRI